MDISEIADWFRGLEVDHQKAPDWVYPFLDILMERKDTCEVTTGRYREFEYSIRIQTFSKTRNVASLSWIRYEQAPYVPHNFVAIGDSVMRPNPTFGYVFCLYVGDLYLLHDHIAKDVPRRLSVQYHWTLC